MNKGTHLIIGAGVVGAALRKILVPYYEVVIRDREGGVAGPFYVIHIAYPWTKNFLRDTKKYIKEYDPKLAIIHSTVPVGTARKIGRIAVASPIRGDHPGLEKRLKTFVKYFGGARARSAAGIFSTIGIKTKICKNAETVELLKILDTTYYAWNIVFCKEVKRICDNMNLDFDEVYTIPNTDYNEGYKKLGKSNVIRPILKPVSGPIGGHCLIPNAGLLDDWITKAIRERNKTYKLSK
ncbi:MAG: hypothetical protein Q8R20_02880 [Nanoarchaeota archaeon]|nr:hypothetical protein [Nanoarchaeota archaeon]